MTVFTIHEENHGLIGVCDSTVKAVVDFLVDKDWIVAEDSVFIKKFNQWVSLRSYFGEHWIDRLSELSVEDFTNLFDGCIYLKQFDVYGVD